MDKREIMQVADLVIAISYRNDMQCYDVVKNREGYPAKNIDLSDLLEIVKPYQPKYLHNIITGWIEKLRIFRLYR